MRVQKALAMRVLLVEDQARMAALLGRGLTEEGYVVDIAHDGAQGLRLAIEHDYDAVVLDAMLPHIDGYELCRRLRAHRHWEPVIMVTARDGVQDRIRGLAAGADDYLVKPFAFTELTTRLGALIQRGASQGQRSLPAVRSALPDSPATTT